MPYRVFYSFHDRQQFVSSDKPVSMEVADIRQDLLAALEGDGDFIGLIDEHGTVLQFIYDELGDRFWVEIPHSNERSSHGRWLPYEECAVLLAELPEQFRPESFDGFEHRPWRTGRVPGHR